MFFQSLLKKTALLGAFLTAGAGGGYVYRDLSIEKNTIRREPERTLFVKDGRSVLIRDAIVWGDNQYVISIAELDSIWESKPRKTPKALMIAKAACESGFKPCLMRYEVGQHEKNRNWAGMDTFDATSGGLFQIMGFNLKIFKVNNWAELCQNIALQADIYDDFMFKCIQIAEPNSKFPPNGKSLIYRAIAVYGSGSPNTVNKLTEINYSNYLYYKKLYPNAKNNNIVGAN